MLICAPQKSKMLCYCSPSRPLLPASLHCFCLLDCRKATGLSVPVLVESSWFELGVFLTFSFFLLLKQLNAFSRDGEQGERKSKVPLLHFFQIRASVLPDIQGERFTQCSWKRSMAECLLPEIGEQNCWRECNKKGQESLEDRFGRQWLGSGKEHLVFQNCNFKLLVDYGRERPDCLWISIVSQD